MTQSLPFETAAIVGAGRWGSAVAIFLARRGCSVSLWAYEDETAREITGRRTNPFLPGYAFPHAVTATSNLNDAITGKDLIVLAVPCQFLRAVLRGIAQSDVDAPFLGINKGIEQNSCRIIPEMVREELGTVAYAHLGGPCFPGGLLGAETPVAETVAGEDPDVVKKIQELFAWNNFRPYRSADVRGVATLGALKNVYAIGAGIASGLGLGEESLSVLVTRALSEIRRLALAMGIPETTVYGLSGVGDLVLTCYSPGSSHNRNLGISLGKGKTIDETLKDFGGQVAEGYYTAACIRKFSQRYEVEMPIAEGIYQVLYEEASVPDVLAGFMERPLKAER